MRTPGHGRPHPQILFKISNIFHFLFSRGSQNIIIFDTPSMRYIVFSKHFFPTCDKIYSSNNDSRPKRKVLRSLHATGRKRKNLPMNMTFPRPTAPTRNWPRIPKSRPSTSRRPTSCTLKMRFFALMQANTSSARSLSRQMPATRCPRAADHRDAD